MNIVISARRYIQPLIGGVDVYANRLGRALQRMGHDVTILAIDTAPSSNGRSISISKDESNGMNIVRFWKSEHLFQDTNALGFDPDMEEAVRALFLELKPDVFIVLNFYLLTLAPVQVAKEMGIPVVHIVTDFVPVCRRATFIRWDGEPCLEGESIHSCSACFVSHHPVGQAVSALMKNVPEEKLVRMAKKYETVKKPHPLGFLHTYWKNVSLMEQRLKNLGSLRHSIDVVLAPTRYTYDIFCENGFRPDQVHLLPFGSEAEHTPVEKPAPADHVRFLFIGRFQPYKGAHLLVEAFNRMNDPKGATLTLYGAPDGYESYFQNLKAVMDKSERVHYGGRLDPADLGQAFSEADYFVLPSTWPENSPLVLLNALESGTPVIASQIGGVTDLVTNGVNGLLYPMGDTEALQAVLQRAIDQPELGEKLRNGIQLPQIEEYARTLIGLIEAGERIVDIQ
ncbi:MAG: glycosyltransferase [Chloroflexi bacterium]|nr:MAG: glycosyltransferase [Chloroflexota bacterium]